MAKYLDYEGLKVLVGQITDADDALSARIETLETHVGDDSVADQIDAKVGALAGSASQTAGADGLALSVTTAGGEVTAITGSIAANTYAAYGTEAKVTALEALHAAGETTGTFKTVAAEAEAAASAAVATVVANAPDAFNTLLEIADWIQKDADGNAETGFDAANRIIALEEKAGTTSVASQISTAIDALAGSASQTAGADGLALSVTSENGEVKSITGSIAANTYAPYSVVATVDTLANTNGTADAPVAGSVAEAKKAADAAQAAADAAQADVDALEELVGTTSVTAQAEAAIAAIAAASKDNGANDLVKVTVTTTAGSVSAVAVDDSALDTKIGDLGKVSEEEGAADHTVKSYVDAKIAASEAGITAIPNSDITDLFSKD